VTIEIRPLLVPRTADAPDAAQFAEQQDLANAFEREVWGNDDFAITVQAALPEYLDEQFTRRLGFTAHEGDRMVGRGVVGIELDEGAKSSWCSIGVVADRRGEGIGTLLLRHAEELSIAEGRPVVRSYTQHSVESVTIAAELLSAATGGPVIPADDSGVRFFLEHGYVLAQTERTNRCLVDEIADDLPALVEDGSRRAGADYELRFWFGETPEDLLESIAAAHEHMALDVPAGSLLVDAERWTPERVQSRERVLIDGGDRPLSVAAVERSTGQVAGYSEIMLADGKTTGEQYDTLVLSGHRGHGLGLWMKAANLQRLRELAPERTAIYTWNADENDHMLAINDRLRFRVVGYTADWQREL
jgi:GNAT superfamily N-acetyltransferase